MMRGRGRVWVCEDWAAAANCGAFCFRYLWDDGVAGDGYFLKHWRLMILVTMTMSGVH